MTEYFWKPAPRGFVTARSAAGWRPGRPGRCGPAAAPVRATDRAGAEPVPCRGRLGTTRSGGGRHPPGRLRTRPRTYLGRLRVALSVTRRAVGKCAADNAGSRRNRVRPRGKSVLIGVVRCVRCAIGHPLRFVVDRDRSTDDGSRGEVPGTEFDSGHRDDDRSRNNRAAPRAGGAAVASPGEPRIADSAPGCAVVTRSGGQARLGNRSGMYRGCANIAPTVFRADFRWVLRNALPYTIRTQGGDRHHTFGLGSHVRSATERRSVNVTHPFE